MYHSTVHLPEDLKRPYIYNVQRYLLMGRKETVQCNVNVIEYYIQ